MKKYIAFLIVCLLLAGCITPAWAAGGNVTYSGDAGRFIFAAGSEYSPADLFPNFKDVMPGDSISQPITVRNDASNKVKIKVYMRSLGAHEESVEFLSQLHLRVEKSEENTMGYMFDAAAHDTAQLTEWVCLGTLYSGGEVNLNVILDIPAELDNTFQQYVGYLDWEFMIEEYEIEPEDPKPPQTGDEMQMGLWIGILVGSAAMLMLLLRFRKRKALKKRGKWTKSAMALSACLFVIWWALGTGATLAWFSDTDSVRNEFKVGLLNIDVSYRNDVVNQYTPLQGSSEVFDDETLYEPGYTQVVYLKIENRGDVAFKYKLALTVKDFTNGRNAWGEEIYLPDYLRYGVVWGESEAEVVNQVKDRMEARMNAPKTADAIWDEALGTWSEIAPYTYDVTDTAHYAALIIHMPEDVDDQANYKGMDVPTVKLGITVHAQQFNAPMEE